MIGMTALAQSTELSLIPLPQSVELQDGEAFSLSYKTKITYADPIAKASAEMLAASLEADLQHKIIVTQAEAATENSIHFSKSSTIDHAEAYELVANEKGVIISASKLGGYFYGSQTLLQLLPVDPQQTVKKLMSKEQIARSIPAVKIADEPTYEWRGIMLDVSRYFMTKEYVLKYIDMMAKHKLNVFHWHLIDDCGWRIEIKKYPKLTEIGAWRGEGDKRHGGFYTQEEIKEVVAYAAARNIIVVPEIEVPAHTLSALAAYPYLGCTGKQFKVPERHSISPEIYCVGRETTWKFLEDVMDEVVTLFPCKYIHIGGDEARYQRWNKCEHCQAKMKAEGLKTPQQLQGWATTRLENYLKKHDKKILGWAEILECGVSNKAGIMTWHKAHHSIDAAKHGNPVMSSLIHHTYFDTPESRLPGEPPAATWLAPVTLSAAYNWDPTPKEIRGTPAAKNILGPNGCLWTDRFLHNAEQLADKPGKGTTASEAYVDYLTLPRMAALAEVGWTKMERKNYGDFKNRMATQYIRYQHAGYNYRKPTPELVMDVVKGGNRYTGKPAILGGTIRYTTDGSNPTFESKTLESELIVPSSTPIKVATFSATEKQGSLVVNYGKKVKDYSKYGQVIGKWKSGKVGDKKPMEVIFDATGKIDSNAEYTVTFLYESGKSRLDIDGITVVRNDVKQVAEDKHKGFTGGQSKNNTYTIKIDSYQTGASFKIKAMIYGDLSSDSNGVVLIKKK